MAPDAVNLWDGSYSAELCSRWEPVLIIGGHYAQVSSSYSPGVLEGESFAQVQQALRDPTSTIAHTIHAGGMRIPAFTCKADGNLLEAMCHDAAVQAALAHIS